MIKKLNLRRHVTQLETMVEVYQEEEIIEVR